jgi:hypothetical protein
VEIERYASGRRIDRRLHKRFAILSRVRSPEFEI